MWVAFLNTEQLVKDFFFKFNAAVACADPLGPDDMIGAIYWRGGTLNRLGHGYQEAGVRKHGSHAHLFNADSSGCVRAQQSITG